MKSILIVFIISMIAVPGYAQTNMHKSYHHHLNRSIKALSEDEVIGYLSGEGMGMAIPAELNHYPGPRHVLDLADSLNLTVEQKTEVQKIYDSMHEKAVELGKEIVEKEELLDSMLSSQNTEAAQVEELLIDISKIKGKLRWVHISAHIQMKEVLYPEQVSTYDRLRGYIK